MGVSAGVDAEVEPGLFVGAVSGTGVEIGIYVGVGRWQAIARGAIIINQDRRIPHRRNLILTVTPTPSS